MQIGRGLSILRHETIEVDVRANLEDSVDCRRSTELDRLTALGQMNWTETHSRSTIHGRRSARNHTELSCFSSRRFQGFSIQFLCIL